MGFLLIVINSCSGQQEMIPYIFSTQEAADTYAQQTKQQIVEIITEEQYRQIIAGQRRPSQIQTRYIFQQQMPIEKEIQEKYQEKSQPKSIFPFIDYRPVINPRYHWNTTDGKGIKRRVF